MMLNSTGIFEKNIESRYIDLGLKFILLLLSPDPQCLFPQL